MLCKMDKSKSKRNETEANKNSYLFLTTIKQNNIKPNKTKQKQMKYKQLQRLQNISFVVLFLNFYPCCAKNKHLHNRNKQTTWQQ